MRYVKTCCFYNWFDVVFAWLTFTFCTSVVLSFWGKALLDVDQTNIIISLLLLWPIILFSKNPQFIMPVAVIMVAANVFLLLKINPARWILSVVIFPFRLLIAAAIIILPLFGILFTILSCGANNEYNEKMRQSKDMRYKKTNREKHRASAIEALPLFVFAGLIAAFFWKLVSSFPDLLFRSNNLEQIAMQDHSTDIPVESCTSEKAETETSTVAMREPVVEVSTTNTDPVHAQIFNNVDMRIETLQPTTRATFVKKYLPETVLLACALLSVVMTFLTNKNDWVVLSFLAFISHILWRGWIIMKIGIIRKTVIKSLLFTFLLLPFVDSIFLVVIGGIIETMVKK